MSKGIILSERASVRIDLNAVQFRYSFTYKGRKFSKAVAINFHDNSATLLEFRDGIRGAIKKTACRMMPELAPEDFIIEESSP